MKAFPDRPRLFRVAVALSAMALAAACGSNSPGLAGTTASPAASAASGVDLEQGTATVMNAQETVLTSPDGFTLYYLTVTPRPRPNAQWRVSPLGPPCSPTGI